MKVASLIFVFFSLIIVKADAQTMPEKQVAAAVDKLTKAMIDGDQKELEQITSDKLTYGHSSGKIQDKAAFVEAIASGQSDFVSTLR